MRTLLVFCLSILVFNPVAMASNVYFDNGLTCPVDDDTHKSDTVYLDELIANNPGTHINLVDGGAIFRLYTNNNATVTMPGGYCNELKAYDFSSVTITGGAIKGRLQAYNNASVTMSDGSIGTIMLARDNTTINMSGGSIRDGIQLSNYATATVTGGTLACLAAWDNATVTMTGGSIGVGLGIYNNGTIYLDGTDFQVNGQTLSNGDKLSDYGMFFEGVEGWGYYTGTITGTLADGSVLDNEFNIYNTGDNAGIGNIIIIPEPCSMVLLGLGGLVLMRKRRTK